MSQSNDSTLETDPAPSEQSSLSAESKKPWQKGAMSATRASLYALGVIAILGGAVWGGRQLLTPSSPPAVAQSRGSQPTPVKLEKLQASPLIQSSQFVGALEAKERVALQAETDGRVTEIFVESGEEVQKGTPILQLSAERSQAEVNRAQADVDAARSAVRTAEAELAAAEADVRSARSEVNLQNEEYQRTQFLVEEGAQAQQQLDRVQRDRESALSRLEAAQKQVDAARSRLDQERSALNRAQAELEAVQEDLKDTLVVSPINGTIGDINAEIGEYLQARNQDDLTVISQNNVLELNLRIPIEQADQLQKGLTVELVTANREQPLKTGRINFISPQVDMQAQAVLAKAVFKNPDGKLKDDQFVQARVIWEEKTGVLMPTTAVSRLGGQTFAFVAQPSEAEDQLIAKQKPVQLGAIQGNNYQVISGLQPGDTLITSGILNLSDGAPIMPQEDSDQ
ncbi:efflux transporter, RND family, MFP subunit [Halothece sp. PCC 7418]|uniref:efflux RND transporter periplasmic adaptor subunit n=1 Tax=Halothece sp. (strain PCC 7418) TaxID=65093 RepID=UPI0002A081B0|nr:efflux RND transporter periplasmic adaptor subunit [Halothece sp. PCC 7418]AFZ45223.1 efflux transporter, RND family, MFP subunit [Halothece sp. PCC 7418]